MTLAHLDHQQSINDDHCFIPGDHLPLVGHLVKRGKSVTQRKLNPLSPSFGLSELYYIQK